MKSNESASDILLFRVLSFNQITTLPSGIFDQLVNLRTLWVYLKHFINVFIEYIYIACFDICSIQRVNVMCLFVRLVNKKLNESFSIFILTYCTFVLRRQLQNQLSNICSTAQIHVRFIWRMIIVVKGIVQYTGYID
jgi:hypothetical protein